MQGQLLKCVSRVLLVVAMLRSAHCFAQTTQPTPPIIQLAGDGVAIGTGHGTKLADAIHALDAGFLRKAIGPAARPKALQAAALFREKIDPRYLAEIDAVADAARIDRGEIMLANCFLDLKPTIACSTMTLPAEAAPDQVARFARNLDFPSLGIADKYSVVLVYHPSDRFAFATIGWPSMIGALSGMNEHGLALANMEVDRTPLMPHAMPYALLYREVLEECKTVDEAIALLDKTPRQTANNLMLMDASGDRAVVELTPEHVVVRRGKPGIALISTNHQRGEDADKPGLCWRYDYLHDASRAEFGKIDRAELQSMLRHVQQRGETIQSMIFEPADRVIYLSTGMNAADGKMRKIDLKPLLTGVSP